MNIKTAIRKIEDSDLSSENKQIAKDLISSVEQEKLIRDCKFKFGKKIKFPSKRWLFSIRSSTVMRLTWGDEKREFATIFYGTGNCFVALISQSTENIFDINLTWNDDICQNIKKIKTFLQTATTNKMAHPIK